MANSLTLDILTPLGPKRESLAVTGVEVPGFLGELGVLPDHEAFVTALVPGVVRFRQDGESIRIAIGRGFLEVTDDGRVAVMTERALTSQEVDVSAAQARLREVEGQLAELANAPIDAPPQRLLRDEQRWLQAQLRAAAAA